MMEEYIYPYEFNHIQKARTFDVSAFVTAYCFDKKPDPEPYWEKYDFAQIFMILEGKGTYTTENGVYPVEPGMMFYRPPHKRSSYAWDTDRVNFALISFVCNSPAMEGIGEKPFRLYEEESATLLDVIRTAARICEPVKENEFRSGMRVKENVPDVVISFIYSSLERFLAMIYCRLKNIDLLLDESQKVSKYMDESRLVAEVKHYLDEHISEQLTVNDICTFFGVSQTALMKKFRKETNQGLMEYFTERKINEAKRRIQKSSDSFTKIAEELGFSSVNYFSKVFKSKTGMTPTEYSRHVSKRRASAGI